MKHITLFVDKKFYGVGKFDGDDQVCIWQFDIESRKPRPVAYFDDAEIAQEFFDVILHISDKYAKIKKASLAFMEAVAGLPDSVSEGENVENAFREEEA